MLWILANPIPHPPKIKYIWVKVSIRYETEKAILVLYEGNKIWIPKSRIHKIRIRENSFWIFVREANLSN